MNTRKMIFLLSMACVLSIGCHKVVYQHRDMAGSEATWGKAQIYIMRDNGTRQANLSNQNRDEYSPDVRHDGKKIVFLVGDNNIYIMDIDGGNVTPVPNAPPDARAPRWSRGQAGGDFILFSHPFAVPQSAIYRIAPDGSGLTRITNPGPTQKDEMADSSDDKHIVFVRYDPENNRDRDLYVKNIWDDRPEVRLTNTPDQSETLPVVSHDGKLLAYLVYQEVILLPVGRIRREQVHVARFTSETTIAVLHTINLQLPAGGGISGIDFSQDDTMLFISMPASDVPGTLINRKHEIFKVRLDGTHQVRLTNNSDQDCCPSAVP